jgi:hypothetical protein
MSVPLCDLQVFHKIITSGHQRLQPLFDCLLTIVVNGEYLCTGSICWSNMHMVLYLFIQPSFDQESPIEIRSLFYKRDLAKKAAVVITALHYSSSHYSVTLQQ